MKSWKGSVATINIKQPQSCSAAYVGPSIFFFFTLTRDFFYLLFFQPHWKKTIHNFSRGNKKILKIKNYMKSRNKQKILLCKDFFLRFGIFLCIFFFVCPVIYLKFVLISFSGLSMIGIRQVWRVVRLFFFSYFLFVCIFQLKANSRRDDRS